MPILPNPRHERFAQALAAGKTATDAYGEAGFKPNDGNAATLKGNQRILNRVAELLSSAAEVTEITIIRLTDMLIEDRSGARAAAQFGAAIAAVMGIGKLHGLIIDRKEIRTGSLDEYTNAELAAIVAAGKAAGFADLLAGSGKALTTTNGSGKPH